MKKYRKKPVVIEAIQLTTDNILEVYTEINGAPNLDSDMAQDAWETYKDLVISKGMTLKTPESGQGTQIANIGDYIVFGESKDLGRHCWPVKPDYFESAYDACHTYDVKI